MSDPVKTTLVRLAREFGFERKSWRLYLRRAEVTAMLDLQRSQYGPQYYLNLYLFAAADRPAFPPFSVADVSVRIERVMTIREDDLRVLLDLEALISDGEREERLYAILADELMPVIGRTETRESVRAQLAEGVLPQWSLWGDAIANLELEAP